jgi:hypothetical protein|tara:strand:- start:3617 stop:5512 length:1896 start_codon:yes stop_codon:yes gene_type:complete
MPFTKFTNLDFDQIKESIKSYLRANSDFSDFDFEGSNFSVLIDTLAYNTYITAFNSNMIVNESFLDSATLRENVVSLARNIGYIPRSRTAAKAEVDIVVDVNTEVDSVVLKRGLVCTGNVNDSNYTFTIPEDVTTTRNTSGSTTFSNVEVYQGTFLTKTFTVDTSLSQKFILDNSYIDTSTIRVYIGDEEGVLGTEYTLVDNILNVDSTSRIFLIQEVQDEKYELLFGDGFIGKKLENGQVITVNYITTDGPDGNGVNEFAFSGTLVDNTDNQNIISLNTASVTRISSSQNGSDSENIDSIKYFAPRIYSSQFRAVTARDYEAIIKKIYPDTESVSIVGGEELSPPEFGTVSISIKPKNGTFVSDFSKQRILSQLKQYSISGINQKIIDLKILHVEIDSSVYFDYSKVSTQDSLKTKVINSLTSYSKSLDINKFGGRLKYSKLLKVIDNTDDAITSNITKIIIRRDLKPAMNQFAQYELCFGNKFHVNSSGYNIKSTGFKISGEADTVYLTDVPNVDLKTGIISIVKPIDDDTTRVVVKSAGTVDYEKGEIVLTTINITSSSLSNGLIEIQAFPESNDVIGLRDLYLNFNISKSTINMVRDVIASGDEISGTLFARDFYTSSYSNGNLIRK